jgi:hypothetical protein
MVRHGFIAVGAAAVFLLAILSARARDDMSGVWVEDYDESIISVDQWGPHCGDAPRSTGRRNRGLSYVVEDRGVDLYFKAIKKGRSFSTSGCHSSNKKLKPKERKLRDKLFLVNCATSESAQSYESGLYSFRIKSIAKIEYRETTRFSRNIKGALCVHTRRVRRVYTHQIGKKAPEIAGKKVGSDRDDPCRKPGKPVRLELSPAKAEVLGSGKICPKVKAFDANGCATEATLSWGKGVPPKGIKLDIRGCLKVTGSARPGKTVVKLAAGKAQAQITLTVKPKLAKRPAVVKPVKPEAPQVTEEPEVDAGVPDAGAAAEPADTPTQPVPAPDAGAPEPEPAAAPAEEWWPRPSAPPAASPYRPRPSSAPTIGRPSTARARPPWPRPRSAPPASACCRWAPSSAPTTAPS